MKKSLTQVLRMFRCSSNFFRSKAPPFYTLTLFTYTSLLICRLTSVKPVPPTLEFGDKHLRGVYSSTAKKLVHFLVLFPYHPLSSPLWSGDTIEQVKANTK